MAGESHQKTGTAMTAATGSTQRQPRRAPTATTSAATPILTHTIGPEPLAFPTIIGDVPRPQPRCDDVGAERYRGGCAECDAEGAPFASDHEPREGPRRKSPCVRARTTRTMGGGSRARSPRLAAGGRCRGTGQGRWAGMREARASIALQSQSSVPTQDGKPHPGEHPMRQRLDKREDHADRRRVEEGPERPVGADRPYRSWRLTEQYAQVSKPNADSAALRTTTYGRAKRPTADSPSMIGDGQLRPRPSP